MIYLVCSCEKEESNYRTDELQFFKETITISPKTKKSAVTGTITLEWYENEDNPRSYTISDNLLQFANITKSELDELLIQEQMLINKSGDPTEEENNDLSPENHAGCIEWCKQKYTDENGEKLPGRGACKANCWVSTTVRVLEAIAEIVPSI